MRKKEYLNEEEFQKNNKKVKTAGAIVMILGLCLVCAGIFVLISASQIEIPKFGSSNRMEVIRAQSDREGLGMLMLLPGIFITIVGCMIRFVVGNQRNIMAYQTQQVMPIAQEGIEKMSPSMGTAAKEIAKGIKEGLSNDETVYCKHCGAQIDVDSNFCNKCGKQQ